MRVAIFILVGLIVTFDQALKFWIKTTMRLGEERSIIGQWFKLHFTENYGMAFGLEFGGEVGKVLLTNFRVIAVFFITWYLLHLIRKKAHWGFIVSVSLILAGALGNIIDSLFYGILFSESHYHTVAEFLPKSGGYAGLLHGRVVDMLYLPVLEGYLPEWLPFWGGQYFIFFRPVFNIADASITTGVLAIFIFQKKFFKKEAETKKKRVLVLCTHNSCRSQMAEGWLRYFGGDNLEVFSAGIHPSGVDPLAIQVMQEAGVDISYHVSNHVNDFLGQSFDYVLTVCDNAKESCPYIPAKEKNIHHNFPDPSGGDIEEFRKVRDMIRQCAEAWVKEWTTGA